MTSYAFSRLTPAQRASLEDKIAQNRREYAEITRRINASASIMRIPEEILVEIMKAYIDVWRADVWTYDRLREFDGGPSFFGWTRITHVCSHWREIALGAPGLWTRIKPVSAASIETFIARSQQQPLQIEGSLFHESFKKPNFIKNWKRVFEESARIESIAVVTEYMSYDNDVPFNVQIGQQGSHFVPEYTEKIEFLAFGRPQFPKLKHLQICVQEEQDHYRPLPPFIHYAGILPSLESVVMDGIPLRDIAPHLPPTMKYLCVKGSSSETLPPGKVLEILAPMHHLTTLSLELRPPRALFGGVTDLSFLDDHPAVNLPRLRSLALDASLSDMASFLSSVVLPPDASLRLSAHTSPDSEAVVNQLAALRSALVLHLFQSSSTPIRALQLHNRKHNPATRSVETILVAWRTSFELASTGTTCVMLPPETDEEEPEEDVALHMRLTGCGTKDILRFLVADLPLTQVQTVAVQGKLADDDDDAPPSSQWDIWCSAFSQMQSVQTLCAGGGFVQSLADALSPPGPPPIALFPVLESVCLHGPKDLEVEQHKEGWLAALEQASKRRKELGAPLSAITICGLSFDAEQVPGLSEAVEKVNWVEGEDIDSEGEDEGMEFGFGMDDEDEDI